MYSYRLIEGANSISLPQATTALSRNSDLGRPAYSDTGQVQGIEATLDGIAGFLMFCSSQCRNTFHLEVYFSQADWYTVDFVSIFCLARSLLLPFVTLTRRL